MVDTVFRNPGPFYDKELELDLTARVPSNPARNWAAEYRFEMRVGPQRRRAGYISLRLGDSDTILLYAGHIGYRVDPEFRGRHYAARSVKLILPLAREHGINPLWITCNPDNIASRRSCELAGGIFVEIVRIPEDLDMYREGERLKCRYRFDL